MCIPATSQADSPIGPTPEEHELSAAIETNLADYWLELGANSNGQVHQSDAIRWSYSGGPFFNRVVLARLDDLSANQQISSVARTFQQKRAAVTWLTGPTTSPPDLGDRLLRAGFSQYDDWKGMAHSLDRLDHLPSLPDDITVQHVDDPKSRHTWGQVVCTSFELPESACRLLVQGVGEAASEGDVDWRHNLAWQDGVPVAASTLFMSRDIAGIYLVSTIPEARNQGLGTAMTCLALKQASELGCRVAVLHATGAGQRIYEKLGFRHHCDIGVYRLAAPRPLWKRAAGAVLHQARRLSRFPKPNAISHDPGAETEKLRGIVR